MAGSTGSCCRYPEDPKRHSADRKQRDDEKGDGLDTHVLAIEETDEIIRAEHEFTPEEYRRVQLKFDLILMPMLMVLYGIQFSDKTSLSAGSVFGLFEDTGMTRAQYGNLTAFFYMAYAVAQFPMAWVLQRLPLGRALGGCIVIWGALVMLLGACHSYAQLAAVRTFLGWFESVVTPGFAIFTASWWLRREQTLRQSMYYAMNTFFAIIFSVGTYFIAKQAEERGGISAWRVINFFLGGTTVGLGIIFLIFGGTPDEVWWLSKREKLMVKARIVSNATGGAERQPWKWHQVRECFRDPQYWNSVVYNVISNIPNGALTTFDRLIFTSFGFTNLQSILFNLPTYALTCTCIIISAVIVRYVRRTAFPLSIFFLVLPMICLFVIGLAKLDKWEKWGLWMTNYLTTISTFVLVWPAISVNVAGRTKKSFFGATSLFCYCVGNIIGSQVFSGEETFTNGLILCATATAVTIVSMCTWWWGYAHANKKREKAFLASGMSMEERERLNRINGEADMTDIENPYFRYQY